MFLLDTDAITHDQNAHPRLSEKVKSTSGEHLFTTSITVEEQFKGRLAYLNTHRNNPRKLARGDVALVQTVHYFSQWNILLFNEEAVSVFQRLQRQRIRIGSQDLRIAAIALLHDFTLVTSNVHDFSQIPHLTSENWTSASP